MADHPNIMLVTCDQLRAFDVGCYGNDVIRTPNIDRLAAEGVRFETAVTNCPVCMPARSALLSGQYARTCTGGLNNAHDWLRDANHWTMQQYPVHGRPHLPDPTLPEILRDSGYHTSAIGKWHIHSWPHEVGFDHYLIPRIYHRHSGQSYTEDGGPEHVPQQWSVDFEAERVARALIDRAAERRPFFMYYNISPPHCPLDDAPDRYRTMYDPDEVPIRENVPRDEDGALPFDERAFRIYLWDFKHYEHRLPYTLRPLGDFTLRNLIAQYYGLTTWVDVALGRMLQALDATGLAEDTIVVFTSDHGDNLGSHGAWQKNLLIEESTHVPLIARWPGALQPATVEGQVASLVDLAPSLLALSGHEVPAHMQGSDLSAALLGAPTDAGSCAFIETRGDGIGIRTPDHLYGIPWAGETPELAEDPHRFYDIASDPYELENLAETGAQADLAADLDARLRRWHRETPWM
jgi:choline-sulfatase